MKYDDLEKTKDLFDIVEDVPSPIENIEMEGASKENLIDEFTLGLKEEDIEEIKDKKTKKAKKKNKDSKLSKKKKIIIIVSIVLVVLIAAAIIIWFLVLKDEEESPKPNEPKEPVVIIEKDNYIYKDGVLTFLNENDEEIGTYTCKNTDENLCYIVNYNDEDNFDTTKIVYENESLIERRSIIYLNKYVFIYDNSESENGVITLYNIEEAKNEGVYTLVKGFSDSNYVILKNNSDKYGAIEFSEDGIEEKLEFTFDYLGMLNKDSKLVAKTNNKYFIYSKDGKLESKGLNYEIKSYNNKYIVVNNEGYYVYDYKSNLIFDEAYDYVRLLNDYAVLIDDRALYIRDYKNNKYNEEGIKLANKNYNETNIYNKEKVYVETKKAFSINETSDSIEVTYPIGNDREKTQVIALNEGKLSAKYEYLNYFDGTLYFYNDEEKSNLIGKYTCSNKNTIKKDTTTFSNCFIASDSFYSKNEVETDQSEFIGWIPIFNERYVFIMDIIDANTPTIILHDLEKNKTLSKYISVDTGSYTKEHKITFKETDSTYIMAQNKNKKYGVIKIEDEVKSAIGFDYTSMEKLRDYYMVGESSGTYLLIDGNAREITSKYGYKIIDYKNNYLKVIDKDKKYYVYDFEGNKVNETGYLHIALYDDYYVVINTDKKLDIHKYADSAFKLSSTIDIGTDDYNNAYEVGKSAKGFTIKIKSTGETINTDEFGVLEGDEVIEAPSTESDNQSENNTEDSSEGTLEENLE